MHQQQTTIAKPRLLPNGKFTRPIAIEGRQYRDSNAILRAINRVHNRDGLPMANGFLVDENGDVQPVSGYGCIGEPFSNCFETAVAS